MRRLPLTTYAISSLQNSRVKRVVKLNDRSQRDAEGLTVVEGVREARRALAAGITPREAFVCPNLLDAEGRAVAAQLEALAGRRQTEVFTVTTAVFAKLAYRATTGGLLLVIPYLDRPLERLPLGRPPFLVVVDGAEKPGNLGAILRTADAAGVDGLIVTGDASTRTDLHNPNVVRASLGALFTVPVAAATVAETIAWLRAHQIAILATTPAAARVYTAVDLTGPIAIVMGSEAHGLPPAWLAAAELQARIPMRGAVDSLNLSAATALLLYEVVRQRYPAGAAAAALGPVS